MRIFVSSSFEDLREHRAAAIRVLRQLGHEVLAMEDMIAGSATPLAKVLEMVDRSEAYVGVFAWRYGYVPSQAADPQVPAPINIPPAADAVAGETSITHYEYLRAVERKLPVMAFLLDEHYPWPPQLIDGFDKTRAQAPANADRIRALRQVLQQERVVSWFTTPSGRSAEMGITSAIIAAGDHQRALKIDLATTWWSTRLYLIASLAQRLTQARRILVVDTKADGALPAPPAAERFVGQLSTSAILSTIGPKLPALGTFAQWPQARPIGYNQVNAEIHGLLAGWRKEFGDAPGTHVNEEMAKIDLTAEILRRWFGDAMLHATTSSSCWTARASFDAYSLFSGCVSSKADSQTVVQGNAA